MKIEKNIPVPAAIGGRKAASEALRMAMKMVAGDCISESDEAKREIEKLEAAIERLQNQIDRERAGRFNHEF